MFDVSSGGKLSFSDSFLNSSRMGIVPPAVEGNGVEWDPAVIEMRKDPTCRIPIGVARETQYCRIAYNCICTGGATCIDDG